MDKIYQYIESIKRLVRDRFPISHIMNEISNLEAELRKLEKPSRVEKPASKPTAEVGKPKKRGRPKGK